MENPFTEENNILGVPYHVLVTTALSDMCRVPAILAATFTNVYKTSGNPVCL